MCATSKGKDYAKRLYDPDTQREHLVMFDLDRCNMRIIVDKVDQLCYLFVRTKLNINLLLSRGAEGPAR